MHGGPSSNISAKQYQRDGHSSDTDSARQGKNLELTNGSIGGPSTGTSAHLAAHNKDSIHAFGAHSTGLFNGSEDSKLANGATGGSLTDRSRGFSDGSISSKSANGANGEQSTDSSMDPSSQNGSSRSANGADGGQLNGNPTEASIENNNFKSTNGANGSQTASDLANGNGPNKDVPTLQSILERMRQDASVDLSDRFGEPESVQQKVDLPNQQYLPAREYLPPRQYLPPVSRTYLPTTNDNIPQAIESPDLLPPVVIH